MARMRDQYSEAVEVFLARSRIAAAFAAGGALATVALVAAMPLPVRVRILLATAVACLAIHALGAAWRPRRARLDCDGAAEIDGVAGRLRDGAFVSPWLTVIRWRPAGARIDRTVLVLPDMLPAAAFRHLRVLLRMR